MRTAARPVDTRPSASVPVSSTRRYPPNRRIRALEQIGATPAPRDVRARATRLAPLDIAPARTSRRTRCARRSR
jgi:hypothetical protein